MLMAVVRVGIEQMENEQVVEVDEVECVAEGG